MCSMRPSRAHIFQFVFRGFSLTSFISIAIISFSFARRRSGSVSAFRVRVAMHWLSVVDNKNAHSSFFRFFVVFFFFGNLKIFSKKWNDASVRAKTEMKYVLMESHLSAMKKKKSQFAKNKVRLVYIAMGDDDEPLHSGTGKSQSQIKSSKFLANAKMKIKTKLHKTWVAREKVISAIRNKCEWLHQNSSKKICALFRARLRPCVGYMRCEVSVTVAHMQIVILQNSFWPNDCSNKSSCMDHTHTHSHTRILISKWNRRRHRRVPLRHPNDIKLPF